MCLSVIANLKKKKTKRPAGESYKFDVLQVPAGRRAGLWDYVLKLLPSFCNECGQGDFDFIGIECAVAVFIPADRDFYLS